MNAVDNPSPTSHEDVNRFLRTLLENVRSVLDDYFVGMYLYGSLALGDFSRDRSDIDFLVATRGELPPATISALRTMHARLFDGGGWGTNLEAAYIPVDAVRTYSPTGPACPLANRSSFLIARPQSNWVLNRHVLYANGVVITGPPLRTILLTLFPQSVCGKRS